MDTGLWIAVGAVVILVLSIGIPAWLGVLQHKNLRLDFRERRRKGKGHSD
jgi:hypothetical protein